MKGNTTLVILAAIIIIGVIALYGFLIYTAVLALKHTDATVNVLGGILIAILINGIGNVKLDSTRGTDRRR